MNNDGKTNMKTLKEYLTQLALRNCAPEHPESVVPEPEPVKNFRLEQFIKEYKPPKKGRWSWKNWNEA